MIIQQIRNATLKIEYGSIIFLIDPWLQDQGTGFLSQSCQTGNARDQMPDECFA